MLAYVVDTNVCVVTNGKSEQADPKCVLECIQKIRECVDILNGKIQGVVVIDTFGEILKEYRGLLSPSGQPGVGDMFFKELCNRQAMPTCEKVVIHKNAHRTYEEFPNDPSLSNFDISDRKFVAVARGSQFGPSVLNAVDSDWYHYQEALSKYINIKQLCPNCLKGNTNR